MKTFTRTLLIATAGLLWALSATAQAPANNPGVMLQGFYYDSYDTSKAKAANGESYGRTKWTDLKSQAQEIAETFDMIWLPPSAKSEGGTGYHPKQWSNQNGDWGTQAELTSLIKKFKEINPNMKVIADIVINHKSGNNWIDFDNENFGTYGKFTLYESGHKSQYVCRDDEVSKQSGWTATGNKDAGYDVQCEASGGYCAARDLDHSNSYLRDAIKAYLQWMKGEIGYDGWRYDLVKGYLGKYTKEYNAAAGAYFSVGEYWDGDYNALTHWIDETGKTSNVFDFCLKYNGFNNSLANKNYSALAGEGGSGTGVGLISWTYKQYAVSFVDNHDTFRPKEPQDCPGCNRFWGDWTQANAYIIAMPGTPCVFYPHWVRCKEDIKKMAAARKACGITNTSSASCKTENGAFRGEIKGKNGTLVCYIGSQGTCPAGFKLACSGNGWAYYTNVTVPVGPVVTMNPTGGYATSVTLSATKGTIYYTTNGTNPTASSTKYTGPIVVTSTNFTVKAIAIDGTTKSSVVSGTFTNEKPKSITVQFKAPAAWTTVKAYAWVGKGETDAEKLLGAWPGTAIGKSGDKYSVTIDTNKATSFNIIFNNGATTDVGKQQTADLPITADACFDGSSLVYSGEPWPTPGKCQDGPTPSSITVRANTNNPAWSGDVYIHAWTGVDTNITEWPGVKMTKSGNWWEYTFSDLSSPLNIIFTDGDKTKAKQTDNIEGLTANTCYSILSTTHEDAWGNQVYDTEETGCPVAADDIESVDGVTLVPNPTSGEMTILSDREFILGNVTTIGGKNCGSFEVNGNTIDVSRLAPNREPYLLRLVDSNGNVTVEFFFRR